MAIRHVQAPKWDGHTSAEVLKRLREWIASPPNTLHGPHC